jgi:hypothetical protein
MWPEADTDGDSPVGSSSSAGLVADAGASNSQASSHADGDRHDDTSSCKCNGERSDDCDHVISSECTAILPITSNGFFSDMLLFVPAGCPSLPFPLLLFFLLLFVSPLGATPLLAATVAGTVAQTFMCHE